jgi:hypothetical protein
MHVPYGVCIFVCVGIFLSCFVMFLFNTVLYRQVAVAARQSSVPYTFHVIDGLISYL